MLMTNIFIFIIEELNSDGFLFLLLAGASSFILYAAKASKNSRKAPHRMLSTARLADKIFKAVNSGVSSNYYAIVNLRDLLTFQHSKLFLEVFV